MRNLKRFFLSKDDFWFCAFSNWDSKQNFHFRKMRKITLNLKNFHHFLHFLNIKYFHLKILDLTESTKVKYSILTRYKRQVKSMQKSKWKENGFHFKSNKNVNIFFWYLLVPFSSSSVAIRQRCFSSQCQYCWLKMKTKFKFKSDEIK